MAENYFSLYIKTNNEETKNQLHELVDAFGESYGKDMESIKSDLITKAITINSDKGEVLVNELTDYVEQYGHGAEDMSLDGKKSEINGFINFNMLFGSPGPEEAPYFVNFFSKLCDESDVRAYITSDEEPWENFIRCIDGKLIENEYNPYEDRKDDIETFESGVYQWWHDQLPDNIKEGILNSVDWASSTILFTGDFERGSHKKMGKLADKEGAGEIQEMYDDNVTMLVIANNADENIIEKAKKNYVKIMSEKDFYKELDY